MKTEKRICSKVKAAWRDTVPTPKMVRELIIQSSNYLSNGDWKIRWENSKTFLVRNYVDASNFYRSYCRRSNVHIKNWIRDGLMNWSCKLVSSELSDDTSACELTCAG